MCFRIGIREFVANIILEPVVVIPGRFTYIWFVSTVNVSQYSMYTI